MKSITDNDIKHITSKDDHSYFINKYRDLWAYHYYNAYIQYYDNKIHKIKFKINIMRNLPILNNRIRGNIVESEYRLQKRIRERANILPLYEEQKKIYLKYKFEQKLRKTLNEKPTIKEKKLKI